MALEIDNYSTKEKLASAKPIRHKTKNLGWLRPDRPRNTTTVHILKTKLKSSDVKTTLEAIIKDPRIDHPLMGRSKSSGKGIFVLFWSYADTWCSDKHSGVCLFIPLSVQILENTALWEQDFGTAAQDDRWIFISLCGSACNYPCLLPCRSSSYGPGSTSEEVVEKCRGWAGAARWPHYLSVYLSIYPVLGASPSPSINCELQWEINSVPCFILLREVATPHFKFTAMHHLTSPRKGEDSQTDAKCLAQCQMAANSRTGNTSLGSAWCRL